MQAENLRPKRVRLEEGRDRTSSVTDLALDQSSEGQIVKQIREVLPHVRSSVLAQALVIEAVSGNVNQAMRKTENWKANTSNK